MREVIVHSLDYTYANNNVPADRFITKFTQKINICTTFLKNCTSSTAVFSVVF
jgi:hypothetical protein